MNKYIIIQLIASNTIVLMEIHNLKNVKETGRRIGVLVKYTTIRNNLCTLDVIKRMYNE